MRYADKTVTGVGSSGWIPLDIHCTPFNIGFGCVVSGTATYTVQHTFDDVQDNDSPTVFDHPDVVGQTANEDGNYAYPVAAIRVTITAGTGSVTITALQAG